MASLKSYLGCVGARMSSENSQRWSRTDFYWNPSYPWVLISTEPPLRSQILIFWEPLRSRS